MKWLLTMMDKINYIVIIPSKNNKIYFKSSHKCVCSLERSINRDFSIDNYGKTVPVPEIKIHYLEVSVKGYFTVIIFSPLTL